MPHDGQPAFQCSLPLTKRLKTNTQNMEYKFVELLSVEFAASDEETVRKQITYRYNNVKAKLALLSARHADVNALVKLKNPSLLLQLQRTPPRLPTGRRVG